MATKQHQNHALILSLIITYQQKNTRGYRLKQVDFDGSFSYSTEVKVDLSLTWQTFSLEQNYPNPFNPSTLINYSLITRLQRLVMLKVYDVLGNEVAIIVNEEQFAGNYEVSFDAKNLSSGTYFYKLQAGTFVETKKMILMR